jgi:4-carboxymuconolactone decarboxylase
MARIELITKKEQIPAERHHEYDEIVGVLGNVGGPFGVLMHSPGLAEMVCKTGAHVRLQSSLTMEEREFAILSMCREKDAAYEWVAHVGTARKAGMRDEAIDVMRNNGDTSTLKEDERDMINYTRELLRNNKVSDETFNALLKRHGERWLVEYTATIGQYQYISAINGAFEMEPRQSDDTLPVPSPNPNKSLAFIQF